MKLLVPSRATHPKEDTSHGGFELLGMAPTPRTPQERGDPPTKGVNKPPKQWDAEDARGCAALRGEAADVPVCSPVSKIA